MMAREDCRNCWSNRSHSIRVSLNVVAFDDAGVAGVGAEQLQLQQQQQQ